jgi:tRNA-(ms[2]io[6]A)-hydroxylase
VLNLASASEPAWLERALGDLDAVLLDHAHAEKKAASTALTLVFRYPERPELARPLSELAREELGHFEQVLTQLERRGRRFGRQRPSPYAGRLQQAVRGHEPARLLDTLLCCALIEARSCERFRLLAGAVDDRVLAKFYEALLAAEARHHGLYVELARGVDAGAPERLEELAAREAQIIAEAPPWPRLHT